MKGEPADAEESDEDKYLGEKTCMGAYLRFRASIEPVMCSHISNFATNFEMTKKLRGRSEFYEMRQVIDLNTHEERLAKIYRKCELN